MTNYHITNFIKKTIKYSNFLLASLGIVVLCLASSYYFKIKNIPSKTVRLVTHLAQDKTNSITNLLTTQIKYASMLASHPVIHQALQNQEKIDDEDRLRSFLEEAGTAENYYSSILINAQGRVLFCNFAPEYEGVELFQQPGSLSPLGKITLRSRMTVTYDITEFTYDPILKKPTLFIVVPIFENGKLLGFMAQNINNSAISTILEDYLLLGKTGNITVGIASSTGILCINHNRLTGIPAFKRFISNNDLTLSMNDQLLIAALHGDNGSELLYNKENPVAASWNYIPILDWGIVVVQPLTELTLPYKNLLTMIYILLTMFILLLVYTLWQSPLSTQLYIRFKSLWQRSYVKRTISFACLGLILFFLFFTLYRFMRDADIQLKTMKAQAQEITARTNNAIENVLKKIALVANSLAENLNTGVLKHSDITSRLKQDLKNYPEVYDITVAFAPYQFNTEKRLYAPYARRDGNDITLEYYDQLYDYTQAQSDIQTDRPWYTETMRTKKGVWFDPYWQHINNNRLFFAGYSVPFFNPQDTHHEHPIGAINITYNFELIQSHIAQLVLGTTGFGILFSSGKTFADPGTLLSFPQKEYVEQSQTMFDLAQEEGNKQLFEMIQEIIEGKTGFYHYEKPDQETTAWMYTESIPSTQWILATQFLANEATLTSLSIRHYCIMLLIILMLLAIIIVLIFHQSSWGIQYYNKILTIILVLGQIFLLLIIRLTPEFELPKNAVKITDQTHINKYIIDQKLYTKNINEPELGVLPFGLHVSSINFSNPTTLDLTGYLWQRITNPKDAYLLQELQFVQAIKPVNFKKIYEYQDNKTTVICWRFFAQLSQQLNLTQYPFDTITIQVQLEHPDYGKNVILVPLLETYNAYFYDNFPALNKTITLSGFNIHSAFFAFEEKKPIQFSLDNKATPYRLQTIYEVTLTRNLLYDFIVFMLPLLIIYILLYTITILSSASNKQKNLFTLSAYTGIIFVAILLHRILRQQYLTGSTLYIEYVFFLLYISFIINVLYLSLSIEHHESHVSAKIFHFFKQFFWPIQLTMLFIITIITFNC